MTDKHAYLIIAHHNFELLQFLMEDLDHELNDLFIHIDLKAKDVLFDTLKKNILHSRVFFIPRIRVNWGGYSQIQCALNLLAEAVSNDQYVYYHLITGETFPLKSQDYIHNFFKKNAGKEFIGFDKSNCSDRVRYFYIFNEIGRPTVKTAVLYIIRCLFLGFQKLLHINFIPQMNMVFKKGFAYWSITHELACYILKDRDLFKKIYKYSFCCDEVFMQTAVYNSSFYERVYDKDDEYKGCMYLARWELCGNQQPRPEGRGMLFSRGGCTQGFNTFLTALKLARGSVQKVLNPFGTNKLDLSFHLNELDILLKSDALFARKFSDPDCLTVVKTLKENRD